MAEEQTFDKLIERVRRGDSQAARELVRLYEPEVRRYIHFRLTTPSLRRFVDSLDICQSVLANFFVHLDKGGLDLASPDQLRKLLITMARNKLYDHARKMHAERRDARRIQPGGGAPLEDVADSIDTPSKQFMTEDLVSAIRDRLSPDELHLIDQRFAGRSWSDLADDLNTSAEALRKRMTRAIDRAAGELGLIEEHHE
jgi:RNA polymerase sigma-70 factor (ECF subfamily)